MTDMRVRVVRSIIVDDGSDGMFWRNGHRWLREHGKEHRLLDIAPNLESRWLMENLLGTDAEACERSKS